MGGSSGIPLGGHDLDELFEKARELRDASKDEAEINAFLEELLIGINNRDVDSVNLRLDEIEQALEGDIEIDRILFGGSVAKHTYVDGLSDVDSLVILDGNELDDTSPSCVLQQFLSVLRRRLPAGLISSISAGQMAITIEYRSGPSIQLLPALELGGQVSVLSQGQSSWSPINPRRFAQRLSEANQSQGGQVVPAIKLTKALLANRLGDRAPSGYHIEALAISAFRDYSGQRTRVAMVRHLIRHASTNVLHRIRDLTGQSTFVDEYLGEANSGRRRALARDLRLAGRLLARRRIADWRAVFE